MAVAVTPVGRRTVFGDRRVGFYDVAFTGNYVTGGEPVTAGLFGLNFIDAVYGAVANSTDLAAAVVVSYEPSTASNGVLLSYESGATGLPLTEKANAEAYIVGQSARLMVIGA